MRVCALQIMMKSIGAGSMVFPEPVFMIGTYDSDGTPNLMTAAWGGIYNDNKIVVCIAGSHLTAENLAKRKAFTVGIADADNIVACDYVGIVSGKVDHDKFRKAGFHAIKSDKVDAPIVKELKMTLECEMESYSNETLIGKIVDIKADESILTDGKPDPKKLRPIVYDPFNHDYLVIGDRVGKAFSDGKKLKDQ